MEGEWKTRSTEKRSGRMNDVSNECELGMSGVYRQ